MAKAQRINIGRSDLQNVPSLLFPDARHTSSHRSLWIDGCQVKERRSINASRIQSERLDYVCQGSADVCTLSLSFTTHDLFVPALPTGCWTAPQLNRFLYPTSTYSKVPIIISHVAVPGSLSKSSEFASCASIASSEYLALGVSHHHPQLMGQST